MKVEHNLRGFERISLPKIMKYASVSVSVSVSVRQSSAIGNYEDAMPGSSFLWIGDSHLNREQVAELRDHLNAWLETGSLETEAHNGS